MKDEKLIKNMLSNPKIRSLGLKEEVLSYIIDVYGNVVLRELLDSGHIYLASGLNLEIVQLTERVHVLRGVAYNSNRKYKLKATMDERLYDNIENYYDKLLKEIE